MMRPSFATVFTLVFVWQDLLRWLGRMLHWKPMETLLHCLGCSTCLTMFAYICRKLNKEYIYMNITNRDLIIFHFSCENNIQKNVLHDWLSIHRIINFFYKHVYWNILVLPICMVSQKLITCISCLKINEYI
jgi:hypothetical protein